MTDTEINVLSRTQIIKVDQLSGSVAIINAGPTGPSVSGSAGPPGADGEPGPPGPSGTSVLSITTPITLFTGLAPSGNYSWTEVDITCYAAMFTRFIVHSTSTSSFSILVTSQPSGAGEEMLLATGMPTNDYALSWPWWFNNDKTPREKKMYIGIKNLGVVNSTFSITDLRGYSLED